MENLILIIVGWIGAVGAINLGLWVLRGCKSEDDHALDVANYEVEYDGGIDA